MKKIIIIGVCGLIAVALLIALINPWNKNETGPDGATGDETTALSGADTSLNSDETNAENDNRETEEMTKETDESEIETQTETEENKETESRENNGGETTEPETNDSELNVDLDEFLTKYSLAWDWEFSNKEKEEDAKIEVQFDSDGMPIIDMPDNYFVYNSNEKKENVKVVGAIVLTPEEYSQYKAGQLAITDYSSQQIPNDYPCYSVNVDHQIALVRNDSLQTTSVYKSLLKYGCYTVRIQTKNVFCLTIKMEMSEEDRLGLIFEENGKLHIFVDEQRYKDGQYLEYVFKTADNQVMDIQCAVFEDD